MRTRWMTSLVKTSKQAAPPLPFGRGRRKLSRRAATQGRANAA